MKQTLTSQQGDATFVSSWSAWLTPPHFRFSTKTLQSPDSKQWESQHPSTRWWFSNPSLPQLTSPQTGSRVFLHLTNRLIMWHCSSVPFNNLQQNKDCCNTMMCGIRTNPESLSSSCYHVGHVQQQKSGSIRERKRKWRLSKYFCMRLGRCSCIFFNSDITCNLDKHSPEDSFWDFSSYYTDVCPSVHTSDQSGRFRQNTARITLNRREKDVEIHFR